MNFASDNACGASPAILQAVVDANAGAAPAYGADDWTVRAEAALSAFFEREVAAFLVTSGTAANALAIAALTPPWGAALCHAHSHVANDECGAPELFTGGAKLVTIEGAAGRIAPRLLADALERMPAGVARQAQPACLSLSQATECGTLYSPDDLRALTRTAHDAGLATHMDGARFANALVALGCSPADLTWRAGIDALSLGATKNGALACEAVVFFDREKAAAFAYQRKRGGHTLSKGRFLGAQMLAWLEGGHWRDLAAHANAQARRLAEGLADIPDMRLAWPCEANEVFAILPKATAAALEAAGARFYVWRPWTLDAPLAADETVIRLIASFATQPAEVDRFLDIARRAPR